MSGQRIDYHIERQRHERFVGRSALLDRLDQLLITDPIDRWVVVTGGPGMGKSAILAAWLARREAAGGCVPHHFIRRGEYDWDDPAKLVGSVVAQIEARFPDHRGDAADAEAHPGARLMSALMRVSVNELRPRGERMVVLIDGLDEYDPPSRFASGDPLSAFLPHALPPGVCFLCATRPRHPYMALLASRDGELVRIDLDDPDSAADNEATVRAFWEATATPLQLDMGLVDELVARARGNLQHAVTLRKYLAGVSKDQRNADAIPRGLDALLVKLWARIATDPLVMRGLGVLCAAREALTLEELGTVEGWSEATQREAFLCGARELLVETRRADAQPEYRLHHDAIRAHITSAIGTAALRGHHAALARHLARWPAPSDPSLHRYALRHALSHRWEAEQWEQVWRLAGDMSFLEARYRALGSHEVEADIARAADRCRARGEHAIAGRLQDLLRALIRESHWLRTSPGATAGLVWNRLRRSGWSMADLDERLQIPPDAKHLRLQLAKTRESPSLIRDLIGHSGAIYACSMTVDGRYVLSASGDHTVKEWDLESGRAVATFEGHAGIVKACAVTPDGRRMVSASDDSTLKVWDLANRKVLRTLTGHTDKVNACAVTCDGRYVVSASDDQTLKAWELESGRIMATFEGHTGCVVSCTVTPDGQRAVSASFDRTLKVWDIRTGRVLVTCVGHTGWVTACTVTRDGRQIISASEDHDLRLWNLDTGQSLATYAGHTDGASACVVTPDGRHVISASWDRTLKVWDLETGVMVASLHGHGDWVTACIVTPDGKRVVSASHDRTLKVWSLGPSSATLAYGGNSSTSTACAVTSDGRRVVAVTHDGKLNVWDAEHGVKISELKTHVDSVTACVVMPDDRRLLIGSSDGMLGVLDLTEGRLLEMWRGHAGRVTACALTPDGRHVVSGSVDQTLKLWDVNQGHALTIF
ncbi:MAG TPA: WD40 repeat domain-containing protein, partial [Kofleriaceae bacterium]|nr:WD40 repeat domain-containing protein [Kofleriaceae bacterium]